MEAVWGVVGAAAGVLACCGLPLAATLVMAALGRRKGRREGGVQEAPGCCPPLPRLKGKAGDRGGGWGRGR
jgi:hypothetical protein